MQILIVYLIIVATVFYLIYKIINSFRKPAAKDDGCTSCDGCSGCEIKSEMLKRQQ